MEDPNSTYAPDRDIPSNPKDNLTSEALSRDNAVYFPNYESTLESSGGDNNYWLLEIKDPKRLEPYIVECEDIIEALEMTFQEGEAFKAIWRKAGQRVGNGKPGNNALRDAEKVAHFGKRMVVIEERNEK